VSYSTLRMIIILMETIKDFIPLPGEGVSTGPDFRKEKQNQNVGYEHSVIKEKEHHEERSGSDRRDKDNRQARHN